MSILNENVTPKELFQSLAIIAVIVVAGLWYFGYIDFRSPELEVSAKELRADYKENELKADLKYKGKTLLVRGSVATAFSQFDKPNVLLSTDSSIFTIQCRFNRNSERIAGLERGEPVEVMGDCSGKTLGNVFLKNCVLK